MAKPENDENNPSEKQTWSTWEELLLACAVHRHGVDSWDSVAAEIHKRNSSLRTLTAFDCRHQYHDLKSRFSRELVSPGSGDDGGGGGGTADDDEISSVPWLEELRKLRVDELRREVERYDLSISSLQMEVKRLEDEREKSLKESDLDKIEEAKESHRETDINAAADEPAKSPDLKENDPGIESENTNVDVKKVADDEEKPAREDSDSCKGSCESVAKESDRAETVRREGNNSPEFVESMDESKGEKETSDVQSSASLPRKETIEKTDDKSLTVDKTQIESRPLIDFIEMLLSHPIGSHFSRRLESQLQETSSEYEKMIKQHIDFEMIRTRVEEGFYKSSRSKFFRDLLLLINNARVFYGERSSEFDSANQLNLLIKKQMALEIRKPPKDESLVMSKEEVITASSLKPRMSVPIVACRKRSSLAGRSSSGSVVEPFKKKTKVEEKAVSEEEEGDETSDKDEEPIVSKKTIKGRTPPSVAKKVGSRNVKTSLNAGLSITKSRLSNDASDSKKTDQEKKGINTNGGSKRQSAASFLKRMKAVSSSETAETAIETVKADSSNGKRGAEQKRSNSKNEKADSGKPSANKKRAIGKKPTNEKGSPVKKNSGSATKRGAASSSPIVAKRGSEASEKEAGSSTRLKKRIRRL